jgi:hypothetical protein
MSNPPGYESIINNIETDENTERLPSYSSINLDDIEINIVLDKYKLKKNINTIKLFGYIGIIINIIYILFSLLIDSNNSNSNITVVYKDDSINLDGILYPIFIMIGISNIFMYILYYNFHFKYLLLENIDKYKKYKLLFMSSYYLKYLISSLFLIIYIYNYSVMISNENIYMVENIFINYLMNEFIEKILILKNRDLLLISN